MAKRSFAQSKIKGSPWTAFVIMTLVIVLGLLAAFGWTTPFRDAEGNFMVLKGAPQIRYGIDIRGGVEAIFEPENLDRKADAREMEAAAKVLNFRLDQLQILDREVITSPTSSRITVRFPWRSDETDFNPDKALKELGEMALLTFRSPDGKVLVDGKNVKNAGVAIDTRTNMPIVQLEFDEEGKKLFAEATKKYLKQPLGIYLDEEQISNPVVQDVIANGTGTINGKFTREEAFDLAAKINGGSLPFAMKATSSSTISPSLGQNSLHVMSQAGLIAFIVICIFMLLRYRLPGFVGCISLSAQVIGILLAISIPQQTLTLQGIAGIILSIGMGVDANIIMAERIREEANTGASLDTFLYNGFTRAFSSVMDGNVTVAIAGVVLMIFGSGTVLSFGYSLLAGVILNGITGVWMTRRMISSLSRFEAFRKPELYGYSKNYKGQKVFAFSSKRKILFSIAVVALVLSLIASLMSGIHLSIQFKGGSLVAYDYDGEISAEEVERTLRDALDMSIQTQLSKGISDESTRLVVSVAGQQSLTPEELSSMTEALRKAWPDANFKLSSSQAVNPSIGREMLRNGLLALVIASFLIIAYVWFSFRKMSGPSAGVCALIALFHDILLAAFFFIIFGSEINETLIAVILTILGFSINNTIVIYDRIREYLPKYRDEQSFEKVVDKAISHSLSRSIYTSLCIFVAVFIALVFALIYDLESIREFAIPILVGTVAGTYSSVCISGPLWSWWKTRHGKSGFES